MKVSFDMITSPLNQLIPLYLSRDHGTRDHMTVSISLVLVG